MVTALLDHSVDSLSALASLINRLSERGVRSSEDKNDWEGGSDWEIGVYALPNASL